MYKFIIQHKYILYKIILSCAPLILFLFSLKTFYAFDFLSNNPSLFLGFYLSYFIKYFSALALLHMISYQLWLFISAPDQSKYTPPSFLAFFKQNGGSFLVTYCYATCVLIITFPINIIGELGVLSLVSLLGERSVHYLINYGGAHIFNAFLKIPAFYLFACLYFCHYNWLSPSRKYGYTEVLRISLKSSAKNFIKLLCILSPIIVIYSFISWLTQHSFAIDFTIAYTSLNIIYDTIFISIFSLLSALYLSKSFTQLSTGSKIT